MSKSHLLPAPALLDFLAPYPHEVQQLALAVRRFVIEHIPHMTEIIYDAANSVGMDFSPSGRSKDAICHVAAYASHVNIVFNRGAELPDPGGHLEGTGKSLRHVTIRRVEDLLNPDLRALLAEAVKRAHTRKARAGLIIKPMLSRKVRAGTVKGSLSLAKAAD
jgi:hypothetical protein